METYYVECEVCYANTAYYSEVNGRIYCQKCKKEYDDSAIDYTEYVTADR